jgi:hypothetical protein
MHGTQKVKKTLDRYESGNTFQHPKEQALEMLRRPSTMTASVIAGPSSSWPSPDSFIVGRRLSEIVDICLGKA